MTAPHPVYVDIASCTNLKSSIVMQGDLFSTRPMGPGLMKSIDLNIKQ